MPSISFNADGLIASLMAHTINNKTEIGEYNILFLDKQIGIIDFGLMTRIKEEIKTNIANIFPDIF
jgi:predicted unusual protein kinase regulating ubiquinone biosynthesis (AarF/ABC1/UbiB family)